MLTHQMWDVKEREKGVKGKSKVSNVRNWKGEVVICKDVETLRGELIKCYYKYHDYLVFTVALVGTFY